ncbi:MAG: hypothetical protein AAGP08_00055 [Pseudomonadota bacterium]
MTFKIVKDLTFTRNVPVHIPTDDGHREQTLRTKFRVLEDESDQVSLIDNPGNKAFIKKIVVEFSDVEGADGKARPHSDALVDELLGLPFVRAALVSMYFREITKVQAGN